jgi:hypothetical protein
MILKLPSNPETTGVANMAKILSNLQIETKPSDLASGDGRHIRYDKTALSICPSLLVHIFKSLGASPNPHAMYRRRVIEQAATQIQMPVFPLAQVILQAMSSDSFIRCLTKNISCRVFYKKS